MIGDNAINKSVSLKLEEEDIEVQRNTNTSHDVGGDAIGLFCIDRKRSIRDPILFYSL